MLNDEIRGHLELGKKQLAKIGVVCQPLDKAIALCQPAAPIQWEWDDENGDWNAEIKGVRYSIEIHKSTRLFEAQCHNGGPCEPCATFCEASDWCQSHADAATPDVVSKARKRILNMIQDAEATILRQPASEGWQIKCDAYRTCLAIIAEESRT